ncbi:MAG: SRPBCC family protein [Ilumatobacteraceae bacterium]
MTAFRSRNHSVATVPVTAEAIWQVLTDSALLARLTPLVDRIVPHGERWAWTLAGISGLGLEVAPTFTERMTFVPVSRIDFQHEPPPGSHERAGVNGTYQITRVDESTTKLGIDLSLCVELPLPSFSRRAVETIMGSTMQRTGDAFAKNLYRHLGIDPSSVSIRTLEGDSAG